MLLLHMLSLAQADSLVIDFKDGLTLSQVSNIVGEELKWAHPNSEDESLCILETNHANELILEFSDHSEIEAIELSITFEAFGLPDDPLYDQQWNFPLIGASSGWEQGGGRGILVAVIDTGVATVSDLRKSNIREGVSFVSNEPSWQDENGHGTHVAGTIAQATNNGIGTAGIAPEVDILPLKALGKYGSGQSEWIASAIDEAVDQGADVINLSLGGSHSKVIEVAVKKALQSGVVIVAAAGNTGTEGISSPASINGVIAVSATGPNDSLAPYSSWGDGITLSAPGGDTTKEGGGILQQTIKGGEEVFIGLQGTSMASPHVAAAAAVLLGAGAGTAHNVRELLVDSAQDLGTEGWDNKYGHGRLDIDAALKQLLWGERGTRGLAAFFLALSIGFVSRIHPLNMVILVGGATISAAGLFILPNTGVDTLPLLNMMNGNVLWQSALPFSLLALILLPYQKLRWMGVAACVGVLIHFSGGLLDEQLMTQYDKETWFGVNIFLVSIPIILAISAARLLEEK